jgi:hypothetical protein
VSTCDDVAISIDLDAYTGAAAQLVCEAPDQSIVGPVNVEIDGFGTWTNQSTGGINIRTPSSWCGLGTAAIEIQATASVRHIEIADPLDMRGWEKIRLRFAVAYGNSPPAGHNLKVLYCCGAACDPELAGSIKNADDGGTDVCRSETVDLPPDAACAGLRVRFEWSSSSAWVFLSAMEVLADLTVSSVSEVSAGTYEATATSCQAMSIPTTCYWPGATDPTLSEAGVLEWQ